ncbi:MAG: molybdopterin cofactor-binding domain-containing protein, partial [Candidatus Dormiibacterota bacterium]
MSTALQYLGQPRPIIDGPEKVSGRARYTADVEVPRMTHARPVLSPHAHARIVSIDAEDARRVPGVVAVLTEADLPSHGKPMNTRPSSILARDYVLYAGQPVALVVAESVAVAQDAAELVFVEYDLLPPVLDPLLAMEENAPLVHPDGLHADEDMANVHAAVSTEDEDEDVKTAPNVQERVHFHRGDVEAGLAEADVVVKRRYHTSTVHQAYMEPHASVATYDPVRKELQIFTSTQGQYA